MQRTKVAILGAGFITDIHMESYHRFVPEAEVVAVYARNAEKAAAFAAKHDIPAWYDENGDFVVAETKEEAIKLFKIRNPQSEIRNLKQDDDVLDTWFSSWLWPMEVFHGMSNPGNVA